MKDKKDKLGLVGRVHYLAWHKDGTVFYDEGHTALQHNQTQDTIVGEVINALDREVGSSASIHAMAIGTGANPGVAGTALSSLGTWEDSSGTHWADSQPSANQLQIVATFTGWAGTVSEAGLFNKVAPVTSGLCFWDGTISQALTASDSLQVTWTITVS